MTCSKHWISPRSCLICNTCCSLFLSQLVQGVIVLATGFVAVTSPVLQSSILGGFVVQFICTEFVHFCSKTTWHHLISSIRPDDIQQRSWGEHRHTWPIETPNSSCLAAQKSHPGRENLAHNNITKYYFQQQKYSFYWGFIGHHIAFVFLAIWEVSELQLRKWHNKSFEITQGVWLHPKEKTIRCHRHGAVVNDTACKEAS